MQCKALPWDQTTSFIVLATFSAHKFLRWCRATVTKLSTTSWLCTEAFRFPGQGGSAEPPCSRKFLVGAKCHKKVPWWSEESKSWHKQVMFFGPKCTLANGHVLPDTQTEVGGVMRTAVSSSARNELVGFGVAIEKQPPRRKLKLRILLGQSPGASWDNKDTSEEYQICLVWVWWYSD